MYLSSSFFGVGLGSYLIKIMDAMEYIISNGAEEDDSPDEFYFESDHLALKGNKDYLALLKTLAILQAQRTRALQDLDTLQHIKEEALMDPDRFISILQRGEDIGVPHRQILAEVPNIEWSEYHTSAPSEVVLRPKIQSVRASSSTSRLKKHTEDDLNGEVTVRGRMFNQNKPETFNQLWTAEEQRRLEELLIEFPPEEVESRRFQKIAEALGNRTRMQVSSRVQKYFLKLMKAGLPVPGRVPRVPSDAPKKTPFGRPTRHRTHFSRPSTFFPQHQDLPVYMSECDDAEELPENVENLSTGKADVIPYSLSDEQRKLNLLRQVRKEKDKGNVLTITHCGFKCDMCHEDPIMGTRWHCLDCPPSISMDFCSDCIVGQLESLSPHPLSHRFEGISSHTPSITNSSFDPDYLPQSFSQSYNYLDPNFLPH